MRQRERWHFHEHPEELVFVPTGFPYLDARIRGVQPGEAFSVIATTGVGKSIYLNQQAAIAIINKFDVVYVVIHMMLKHAILLSMCNETVKRDAIFPKFCKFIHILPLSPAKMYKKPCFCANFQ